MYQQLFTRLALTGASSSEVSQPVAMQGANGTQFDFVVISLSGTGTPTVTITIQESNDLENWKDRSGTGSTSNSTAVGYTLSAVATSVSAGYVRAKVVLTGTTPIAVVSVGLNTAAL